MESISEEGGTPRKGKGKGKGKGGKGGKKKGKKKGKGVTIAATEVNDESGKGGGGSGGGGVRFTQPDVRFFNAFLPFFHHHFIILNIYKKRFMYFSFNFNWFPGDGVFR